MRPLVLLCLLFLGSCDNRRISRDREARLQPVISFMDNFLQEHHRLPTQNEFSTGTRSLGNMLVLRDRTNKYAASKGAKSETDYMVGIWRADWYHYYKSWDRSFLDGSDEVFSGPTKDAQTDTRVLQIALKLYQTQRGELPTLPPAAGTAMIYARGPQQNVDIHGLRPERVSAAGEYLDPWQHPFIFRAAGDRFVVLSLGPDGQFETADDISSED
jgi:hypothetical protein